MFVGKARCLSLLESPEKCCTQIAYLVIKIRLGYKNLRVQKATANFAFCRFWNGHTFLAIAITESTERQSSYSFLQFASARKTYVQNSPSRSSYPFNQLALPARRFSIRILKFGWMELDPPPSMLLLLFLSLP